MNKEVQQEIISLEQRYTELCESIPQAVKDKRQNEVFEEMDRINEKLDYIFEIGHFYK